MYQQNVLCIIIMKFETNSILAILYLYRALNSVTAKYKCKKLLTVREWTIWRPLIKTKFFRVNIWSILIAPKLKALLWIKHNFWSPIANWKATECILKERKAQILEKEWCSQVFQDRDLRTRARLCRFLLFTPKTWLLLSNTILKMWSLAM